MVLSVAALGLSDSAYRLLKTSDRRRALYSPRSLTLANNAISNDLQFLGSLDLVQNMGHRLKGLSDITFLDICISE